MTNLVALEQTIADLQSLARAEREYGAGKRNPWAGATAKLEELRKQRDELRAEQARERVQRLVSEYERALDQIESATKAVAAAQRDRADLEASPTIQRYKAAPGVASRSGFGMRFGSWCGWFESARSVAMQNPNEYPVEGWPKAVVFSDTERCMIRRWRQACGAEIVASSVVASARYRLAELQTLHPELRGLPRR